MKRSSAGEKIVHPLFDNRIYDSLRGFVIPAVFGMVLQVKMVEKPLTEDSRNVII